MRRRFLCLAGDEILRISDRLTHCAFLCQIPRLEHWRLRFNIYVFRVVFACGWVFVGWVEQLCQRRWKIGECSEAYKCVQKVCVYAASADFISMTTQNRLFEPRCAPVFCCHAQGAVLCYIASTPCLSLDLLVELIAHTLVVCIGKIWQ